MTGALVLDASVAIALVRHEPNREDLRDALRASARRRQRRLVPDVFWLELANVLVRRHKLTASQALEVLREVDDLGLDSLPLDRATLLVAIDFAARTGLSAYDAAYLALAEVEDARLLTLDRKLAAAAGPRAVRLSSFGPAGLAETPAPYGSEPVDWSRFGAYLARIRAELRESGAAAAAAPKRS